MQVKQRTAVITGALGGIGTALVEIFSRAGYKVIAIDCGSKSKFASPAMFVSADLERFVNDEKYAQRLITEIRAFIADAGLDVLVNNAAIQLLGNIEKISREDWRKTLDVNLSAALFLSQALLADLEKNMGSVVNISSVHARLTKRNFIAYATSKAALSGLTRALAIDLGGRVRVNAIEPAAIDTPMLLTGFTSEPERYEQLKECHPQQRIGTATEVAQLAHAIVEGKFGFMHGACLSLDGGISCQLHDPI
jgi:NAD(P)-dependent dehydrogenase (short-subunit alcohol dehydrogenase family)